jgi:OmcA/MtrC family decaheme c-type cytochrome
MTPARRSRLLPRCLPLVLLTVAACDDSDPAPEIGIAPDPIVGSADVLPGVVVTIDAVRGRAAGRADVGDRLSVDFTVRTDAGEPLELTGFARGAIMVSGPTNNYQRVIASQGDVLTRSVKRALGVYTYDFAVPIPATYLAPLNDTEALTEGELTGQALVGGTYTVGLELRKDYTVDGELLRDPGNTTADFLLGSATALEPREVVTFANCNQCHTELRAHGDNRNNVKNCLLCHTAGAEDKNDPNVAGGTPGAAIDFKVMIHKIHSGQHLPSVLGVTTNPDGSRNYAATPQPYQLVGFGNSVIDFSTVTWPAWPSFYTPMPRDAGFTTLVSANQTKENTMRRGPAECAECHGDPDDDGPLPAPAQGDLIWAQPTIASCQSCHDDWNPDHPYTANLQTMPIQRDNAACKDCHRVEGTFLDVKDAHRHPLADPTVAEGVVFDIQSVTDVGDADGKFEPGEKVQIAFDVKNTAGNAIAASALSRIEVILSGPTTNPQVVSYQRVAQNAFVGNGPYTFRLPEQVYYEPVGTSTGVLETFATSRAPIWNVTNAATTLARRTGTTTSTTLAAGAVPTQNYIDVASGAGFVNNDFIVIDDLVPGVREYMKVQWVDGTRLWFGSYYSTSYKPNLKIAHAVGATVQKVTLATVPTASWTADAQTGVITEVVEFGAGEVLASYTTDFVVPSTYPGALNDTPVNGEDWGDWTGLPVLSGTYTLDVHGARSLSVTRSGEATSYTEGADSTAVKLLFGDATEVTEVTRIDPQACYGCHNSLQFHGGSRRSVEACLSCHGTAGAEGQPRYSNQSSGGFGHPVEFRWLAHNLHKDVFPAMPGGVQDCAKCHGQNTAWTEPAPRLHPQQSVLTRAWRASCSGCHDSSSALAHMDVNTTATGAEACSVCHGTGDTLDVTNVHRIR